MKKKKYINDSFYYGILYNLVLSNPSSYSRISTPLN